MKLFKLFFVSKTITPRAMWVQRNIHYACKKVSKWSNDTLQLNWEWFPEQDESPPKLIEQNLLRLYSKYKTQENPLEQNYFFESWIDYIAKWNCMLNSIQNLCFILQNMEAKQEQEKKQKILINPLLNQF